MPERIQQQTGRRLDALVEQIDARLRAVDGDERRLVEAAKAVAVWRADTPVETQRVSL